MERYGNIRFTRRVVAFVCMLVVALSSLIPHQIVKADSTHVLEQYIYDGFENKVSFYKHLAEINGDYKLIWVRASIDVGSGSSVVYETRDYMYLIASKDSVTCKGQFFSYNLCSDNSAYIARAPMSPMTYSEYLAQNKNGLLVYENGSLVKPSSFYEFVNVDSEDSLNKKIVDMYKNGEISDNVSSPTKVTNESIGYLQDVKLNLSYVTPIKGDSIFETTNYQIYSDMVYNLKWNGKKTTTDFDLSDSYVQLYAKAEYRKSEFDDVIASDFFALSDSKASLGKIKYSFMELFEKSDKCKSAYLSDYPLSSADYKNGKLQACSVTPNIKFKFYIRVYKGTDRGPWLCVSEKGSHHSNEFVNSGVKVPFNVSSGGLDSDGTYKPDGNINENGNGITGTGTDRDDADADTNANDKIQSKHDSSNTTFDKLEEFVQGIGDVPKMIADIFSFLPSWCLDVVGIGFSLLMILIVVKFIRG